MTQIKADEIAQLVGGVIEGDASVVILKPGKIEGSQTGDVTFLANPKYANFLYETKASLVIIPSDFVIEKPLSVTVIKHPMPYYAFCMVLNQYFNPHTNRVGIHETAIIHASAKIGENVYIGPYVVIEEGALIGDGVQLYPHVYIGKNAKVGNKTLFYSGVKLYAECIVGNHCIIHAGTAIGSDGFGFAPTPDGTYAKIPQIGNVIIEDHVETGANCCIDRATMGSTILRKGVKLDNMVQIAHNAEVGENTVIAGLSGVAGSTKVGKQCVIGAQVGIVGHITIADGTQIGGQTGVPKSIKEPNQQFIGSPAMPVKEAFKSQVLQRNLPELEKRVRALENIIKELKKE
ncbi:MAG: UDP-3-O-(3-hydroxymyristoyl)glucosamine N-acyltransferase [Bacteroidota bacterium]|nr:UDP-3-O-(3-hydroxymyristoyl)glucosamine N-acyltransferase [Bacteroidota bacterium]